MLIEPAEGRGAHHRRARGRHPRAARLQGGYSVIGRERRLCLGSVLGPEMRVTAAGSAAGARGLNIGCAGGCDDSDRRRTLCS